MYRAHPTRRVESQKRELKVEETKEKLEETKDSAESQKRELKVDIHTGVIRRRSRWNLKKELMNGSKR